MNKCNMCDKNGAGHQCGKCKVATYCSELCQKKHWKYQHKGECRPCITDTVLLSHIFDGRNKDDILEYANQRGVESYQERGYSSIQSTALALQVSLKELMMGLLAAPGEVSSDTWARHWTAAERTALEVKEHKISEHEKFSNRLSSGFTALLEFDGEIRRLPLRLCSGLDDYGCLKLVFAYSGHEGVEALKFFSQQYYDEGDASFLMMTKTCVDNGIHFGAATESMHDSLDRKEFTPGQIAFIPGYDELTEAATAANIIMPINRKNRSGLYMFEICNIESWDSL